MRTVKLSGIIALFTAVLVVSNQGFASDPVKQLQGQVCLVTDSPASLIDQALIDQGRGCCSWHGGQCGFSFGMIVCCDNTYSPSCRC